MKKHELLTESLKRFPNGSKVKSKLSGEFISELPYWIDGTGSVSDKKGKCLFNNTVSPKKWAEIVTHKKPILVSEDGVDLFEGDEFWGADHFADRTWRLATFNGNAFKADEETPSQSDLTKYFSTREAAEKWIDEANKLKEIEIEVSSIGSVLIKNDMVIMNGTVRELSLENIQSIMNAFIELKTLSK